MWKYFGKIKSKENRLYPLPFVILTQWLQQNLHSPFWSQSSPNVILWLAIIFVKPERGIWFRITICVLYKHPTSPSVLPLSSSCWSEKQKECVIKAPQFRGQPIAGPLRAVTQRSLHYRKKVNTSIFGYIESCIFGTVKGPVRSSTHVTRNWGTSLQIWMCCGRADKKLTT